MNGVGGQDLPGKSRVAIVLIGNIGTYHPLDVIKPIVLQLLLEGCSFGHLLKTVMIKNVYHNDVANGNEITPCNKIDKPLVVYRFPGNFMTSITTLRT